MSATRLGLLLGFFTVIALAVVTLRVAQARSVARALRCESRWIESRRTLWNLQVAVSRLKSPRRIRERVVWFETGVVPPAEDTAPLGRVTLVTHPQHE